MYYNEQEFPMVVIISFVIFFFAMLLLTASHTAFLSILFTFLYFILKFMYEEKKVKSKILTFGIALALLIGLYITKNIGGITGDSCGAIDETVEVTILLMLVIVHVL